ncbi:MAG: ATP-binding protein [Acidobacteriota bacterium]|nr:ATP-binding protein [Acidobacteriota bacterium]
MLPVADGPGLAHDAGNLLGALGLYCDLLDLPGVLRPEHAHYARELRLLSERSGVLIDRLMRGERRVGLPIEPVAAASIFDAPAIPGQVSAATVVRAFAPLLQSLATPQATVSMAVASGLPELPFAAEVLERILVNLTCNAVAAARRHNPTDAAGNATSGRIHIGVCGGPAYFRLTVLDNGPGMGAAMAEAFLKPAALPPGAQHGLGHRVIHDLIQSTGGELSIDVTPHRGTTLQIDWPIEVGRTTRRPRLHAAKCLSSRKTHHLHQANPVPPVPQVPQGVPISC